nr:RDD family protein [Candidatus Poseidoniaceae archaeon]
MVDAAVSLHDGNPARQLVAEGAPEGVLLAPSWKRMAAYLLDVIFIMGVLTLFTQGTFIVWLYSLQGLKEAPHIVIFHWLVLFTVHWLYFKYTGLW